MLIEPDVHQSRCIYIRRFTHFLRFFVEETKSIRFDLKRGNLVASFSFLLFARDYIRETRQGKRRVCGLSKSAWFTWVVVVCCALATILTQLVESGATTTSAGGEKRGEAVWRQSERESEREERERKNLGLFRNRAQLTAMRIFFFAPQKFP